MSWAYLVIDFTAKNHEEWIAELNKQFDDGVISSIVCADHRIRIYVTLRSHSPFWDTIDAEKNVKLTMDEETIIAKTYFPHLAPDM